MEVQRTRPISLARLWYYRSYVNLAGTLSIPDVIKREASLLKMEEYTNPDSGMSLSGTIKGSINIPVIGNHIMRHPRCRSE